MPGTILSVADERLKRSRTRTAAGRHERRTSPVRKNEKTTRVAMALVLTVILASATAFAGNPDAKEAAADMEWGYKAARNGYWQEALLRFQHADAEPGVCHE